MRRARLAMLASGVIAVSLAAGSALRATGRPRPVPAAVAEGSYDAAVVEASKRKQLAEVMADAAPGSWSRHAAAASAELGYAELTGDHAAYEAADRSLAEAFRVARASIDDDAVGPLLLKAQLSYELHRMQPALDSLGPVEKQAEFFHDDKLLAEIASLRGAVTFAMGRYDEGLALLRRSIELDPAPGHWQRLALALASLGRDEEAERIFAETERTATAPRAHAWLELQRGKMAMARGRRTEARRHLERSLQLFPGFWQTEEHLAELDADEGHHERAIAAYRGLVAKTRDPEFMDALAELVAERDPAESESLRARSNALYEERLARLPEASYGHALEHFLRLAPDASRAVELAEKNLALRPNGEARTRLAQAYLRAGRIAEARDQAAAVLATPWVSAESFATAAVALRLAGDRGADALEARARALNPHAMEEIGWLQPG
jgi:tetratricopeptide (TPR) repeat protein